MRTLAEITTNDVTSELRAQYKDHVTRWESELHPAGELELYFAAEIVRATWRIERYAAIDAPEMTDATRAAWLRHSDRTNLGIRRNLEELRRIQSDRCLQNHTGIHLPGIATLKPILSRLKSPKTQTDPVSNEKPDPAAVSRSEAILRAQIQEEERRQLAEFARQRPHVPAPAGRNAPCPCNSGQKYKRCCGDYSRNSAAALALHSEAA